ncbi:hypothetical protein [Acetobacter orleanensis]|nr:hypothetical protein [Acetobacter orleanensis]
MPIVLPERGNATGAVSGSVSCYFAEILPQMMDAALDIHPL